MRNGQSAGMVRPSSWMASTVLRAMSPSEAMMAVAGSGPCQHVPGDAPGGFGVAGVEPDEVLGEGCRPCSVEGRPHAVEAVRDLRGVQFHSGDVGGAGFEGGDEGDPAVSGLEEVPGGVVGDPGHVHRDGFDVEPGSGAVQEHQGAAGFVDPAQVPGVHRRGRCDDQAVDAFVQEHLHGLDFGGAFLVGVDQDDVVAAFFAVSVMPRVARPKCGFSMSPTTTPMVFDFPVFMLRASSFGR